MAGYWTAHTKLFTCLIWFDWVNNKFPRTALIKCRCLSDSRIPMKTHHEEEELCRGTCDCEELLLLINISSPDKLQRIRLSATFCIIFGSWPKKINLNGTLDCRGTCKCRGIRCRVVDPVNYSFVRTTRDIPSEYLTWLRKIWRMSLRFVKIDPC